MKNSKLLPLAIAMWLSYPCVFAQDTTRYQLRLSVPLADFPQLNDLPYRYPSMNQALEFSNDFYELGYLGIDKLGNGLFKPKTRPYTKGRKLINGIFKYAASLGFAKYGSELPIPLGVWAYEEFHRSVLGIGGINSKNGNWILNRWDGTVYGVSDTELSNLKRTNPDQLLYAYVAGVQSEILLNQKISTQDFYKKRTLAKNALLLYNAYYVYDYFRFSASPESDSVKVWVSPHENTNPRERDFAGADLTAWAYDMFSPDRAFGERSPFQNGEGVNRRVGFSELSTDAQKFIGKQKRLSLLNFANPAIFFINRIELGRSFSFNFFAQYVPTHFGNDVAVYLPMKLNKSDLLFALHEYSNKDRKGFGLDLGTYNKRISKRLETDFIIHLWDQPRNFYASDNLLGGSFEFQGRYGIGKNVGIALSVTGKTGGWQIGSPYLKSNISSRIGLTYDLRKRNN